MAGPLARDRTFLFRVLFGLALLLGWELASDRLIGSFWVSSPSRIAGYFVTIVRSGELFGHVGVTLLAAVSGYAIGAAAGVIVGFLLAEFPAVARVLDPYIRAFYGIPRIALAPLFIIWFGIGIMSKVVLVVLVVFFLVFASTYAGVKNVDPALVNVVRIFGGDRWDVVRKVTLPASVPWILNGLELSVPYALVGAVTGEFIASSRGLGYLIALHSNLFFTTGAMTGIVLLAATVLVASLFIGRLERRLLRWRPRAAGAGETASEIY
jgi:NitT/TauT family transport system permease protein